MDRQLAVSAWSRGRPAIGLDGPGQHEPVVIVGVLADQIHPARGTANACGRPKAGLECVQNLQGCFQRRLLSQICFAFSLRICVVNQEVMGAWDWKTVAVRFCCAYRLRGLQSPTMSLSAFLSRRVVTPEGILAAAVLVEDGRILDVVPPDQLPAQISVKDLGAAAILPGLVDSHLHVNEPGRTEWEGFRTATRGAAAGGYTLLVDMPLNCL